MKSGTVPNTVYGGSTAESRNAQKWRRPIDCRAFTLRCSGNLVAKAFLLMFLWIFFFLIRWCGLDLHLTWMHWMRWFLLIIIIIIFQTANSPHRRLSETQLYFYHHLFIRNLTHSHTSLLYTTIYVFYASLIASIFIRHINLFQFSNIKRTNNKPIEKVLQFSPFITIRESRKCFRSSTKSSYFLTSTLLSCQSHCFHSLYISMRISIFSWTRWQN